MRHYWVTWSGRGAATVNAASKDEATAIAANEGGVREVHELPYPRQPQLNPGDNPTPSFCYGRSECLDRTSCPQRRACDD